MLTLGDDELTLRDGRTLAALRQVGIGRPVRDQGQRAVALSPDERTVAVGEADGAVRFVDLPTGAVRRASGRHGGPVTAARFTPDGASLVTTSEDGDAIVWDVRARAAAETLSGHANGIAALELTGDGGTLYTAGLDGSIFVWDLTGTRRLGRPFEAGGPSPPLAALSSDGRRLAIGQRDGVVSVMDFATPARRREFAVIPDGERDRRARVRAGQPAAGGRRHRRTRCSWTPTAAGSWAGSTRRAAWDPPTPGRAATAGCSRRRGPLPATPLKWMSGASQMAVASPVRCASTTRSSISS